MSRHWGDLRAVAVWPARALEPPAVVPLAIAKHLQVLGLIGKCLLQRIYSFSASRPGLAGAGSIMLC